MIRQDIENDPKIIEFIDDRDLMEASAKNLVNAMLKYCQVQDMTPLELIREAKEDQGKYQYVSERRIKRRLINFRKHMKNKGYRGRYAKSLMTLVRGFYNEHEIELPRISMKKFPIHTKRQDDLPTFDDLKKVLEHANKQLTAIILLKLSSGMDSTTTLHLTYKMFWDSLKNELDDLGITITNPLDMNEIMEKTKDHDIILTWSLERSKIGDFQHYTCNTPEATRAIIRYLVSKPPSKMDSPLFRTRGKPNDFVLEDTLVANCNMLNKLAGLGKVGASGKFHAHVLRTMFATICFKNNIRREFVDFMLGHKIDETSLAYHVGTKEGVREQYEKVVEDLTVGNVEYTRVKDRKITELEEQLRALKEEKEEDDKGRVVYRRKIR